MALQKNQLTAIIPAHPMGEGQRTQFRDLFHFAANERTCQQSCHLQSELQRSLLMAKRPIDAEGPGAILERGGKREAEAAQVLDLNMNCQ